MPDDLKPPEIKTEKDIKDINDTLMTIGITSVITVSLVLLAGIIISAVELLVIITS